MHSNDDNNDSSTSQSNRTNTVVGGCIVDQLMLVSWCWPQYSHIKVGRNAPQFAQQDTQHFIHGGAAPAVPFELVFHNSLANLSLARGSSRQMRVARHNNLALLIKEDLTDDQQTNKEAAVVRESRQLTQHAQNGV